MITCTCHYLYLWVEMCLHINHLWGLGLLWKVVRCHAVHKKEYRGIFMKWNKCYICCAICIWDELIILNWSTVVDMAVARGIQRNIDIVILFVLYCCHADGYIIDYLSVLSLMQCVNLKKGTKCFWWRMEEMQWEHVAICPSWKN